jgi:hypothetical protein
MAARAQKSGVADDKGGAVAPARGEFRRQAVRSGRAQKAATGSTNCIVIVANRMLPLKPELGE